MAQQRATMINPAIEELLDRVDSKFTLVSVSAKRARQINAYFNQLGEGVGHNAPPQVASVSRKPLSIALEELVADKLEYVRTDANPLFVAPVVETSDAPVAETPSAS
jgi:DNA-directed RNA polymerase subunit omega